MSYNYFYGQVDKSSSIPVVRAVYFTDAERIRQPYPNEIIRCPHNEIDMIQLADGIYVIGTINPNGTGKIYKFSTHLRSPEEFIAYIVEHFLMAKVANVLKDII